MNRYCKKLTMSSVDREVQCDGKDFVEDDSVLVMKTPIANLMDEELVCSFKFYKFVKTVF